VNRFNNLRRKSDNKLRVIIYKSRYNVVLFGLYTLSEVAKTITICRSQQRIEIVKMM